MRGVPYPGSQCPEVLDPGFLVPLIHHAKYICLDMISTSENCRQKKILALKIIHLLVILVETTKVCNWRTRIQIYYSLLDQVHTGSCSFSFGFKILDSMIWTHFSAFMLSMIKSKDRVAKAADKKRISGGGRVAFVFYDRCKNLWVGRWGISCSYKFGTWSWLQWPCRSTRHG